MITIPENLSTANKAAVENFLSLTNAAFANTERLAALNLNFARSFLEDGVASAKALLSAKDAQQFFALQKTLTQPAVDKLLSYSRSVYAIATDAKGEVSKLVEEQFAEVSKNVSDALDKAAKSAPAGSDGAIAAVRSAITVANSAFDNISKASKQVVEIAEANFATATSATVKAASKLKKAA